MTGAELKRIRLARGLSLSEMGRELGFQGGTKGRKASVWKLENGVNRITEWREHKANQLKEQGK